MTEQPSWERLPDESQQAWEAFTVYRDTPSPQRSLRAVGRQLGKSETLIERWSVKHRWIQRVRDMNANNDRKWLEALADERAEAARRHYEIARRLLDKVDAHVEQADMTDLTFTQTVRVAGDVMRMEREAMESGRRVIQDNELSDVTPPVVVITGCDELQ